MACKTSKSKHGAIISYKEIFSKVKLNEDLFYITIDDDGNLDYDTGHIINGRQKYKIIGIMHCTDGPAWKKNEDVDYLIDGYLYSSKEEWFVALTSEQKYEAIWNI